MAIYVITEDYGYDGQKTTTVDCDLGELELIRKNLDSAGEVTIESLDEWVNHYQMDSAEFAKLTSQSKRGIWWLAVDKVAINELLAQRSSTNHQIWSYIDDYDHDVKHFHVTLAFDVAEEECPAEDTYDCGVIVKGLAYNERCAALVVEISKHLTCHNKHPHITLATADGVPPVYSNDMLAGKDGAYHFLPLAAELEGTLEFFEFS